MSEITMGGHCYCGAVSFEVSGKSDWVGHCHCHVCRGQTGAAFATFLWYPDGGVTWLGDPRHEHPRHRTSARSQEGIGPSVRVCRRPAHWPRSRALS